MIAGLKNLSLLGRIRIFIIALIVFPVAVMVFFGIFQYAKGVGNNVEKSANDRMDFAMGVVRDRLAGVEENVNSVPYDFNLNDMYTKRSKGEMNDADIYAKTVNYLFSRIAGRPYLKIASFYFVDAPESPYMSSFNNTYSAYMAALHKEILSFVNGYKPDLGYFAGNDGDVFIVKKLYDRNTFKQFGVISFQIDRDYLMDSAYKAVGQTGSMVVQYSNGQEFDIGAPPEADKKEASGVIAALSKDTQAQYKDMGERYLISGAIQKENLTIKYAAYMPSENIRQEYYKALLWPVLIIILMIPVLIILASAIYRNTMVPISDLVSKMKLLQAGEFGIQAKAGRKDELGFVVDSFNEMSGELKRLVDRVFREEVALKNAQLEALQSQINPHFLYNTLEIINWKARLSGDEEIPEIITSLGTLLDAGMNRGGQRMVPLSEELKNIEAYIYLLKMRYGKKLSVTLDADTNLLDALVPKLIIQPVLENAVYHGIEPMGGGNIAVEIRQACGDIFCMVRDDGAGMEEAVLQRVRENIESLSREDKSSTRIGLVNVHERIRLTDGEGYGITIESREKAGTVVLLKMKLQKQP